ncbi:hypothetical protein FRX31_010041 [Thalictrum thalictroides]|uniref:Secreted protein n=1 Tax=Thalictrum thalictroides TaxID=46969 RepID=A0A7J6WWC6_THATH|nr:hypothetical protein FRX31_010041 [Thalictrum thalictroides]
MSSLFTFLSISMPISQVVHAYRQLVCCSAKKGQQITGTPAHILSIVEFHPACVRNPPTEGCERTWSCGHQLASIPRSFVALVNSAGKVAEPPIITSGLIIHKKG